ncbi:hypothetical protein CVT26_011934 [Gymnopilus dilepis]|uniref:Uncharacterized protein n=1 Tax=Gymnopilus dilepis TaxID=231916 RepID=A0A409X8N0_9AGAR|nr:hypothetical protein CVT26_011934 [Gymnopilus dilepis]
MVFITPGVGFLAFVHLEISSGFSCQSTLRCISIMIKNWRDAAAMGARIVSEAPEKLLGNVDILTLMETGYPGEHFHYNMEAVLGTGIFNSDGEMFHWLITRPMFSRERISHFELFDRKAQQVTSKLEERLQEGYAVDFSRLDLMSRFTLDLAAEFLFGHDGESLSAGLPYPHNAPPIIRCVDPVVLKDEVLNIMPEGTPQHRRCPLSFYPAVLARLREEILSKVGPTHRPEVSTCRD